MSTSYQGNIAIANGYEAVTPSDTAENTYDAIFVGTSGNIALVKKGGTTAVTFNNVGDGEFLPLSCSKVMSTNTTATNIVGLKFN